ncbi:MULTISPECIES: DUF58 domain-containing protein [Bacillaceae]|uniref:DUF58 domain-containing protein n=1 Tax=Evansella alkalicola TaxID=745819 RepID=A0ABS6JPY5_9BACI|nr:MULTISPECIES: DUF58 domain-containing protein [Bacillaceae]MBU9720626.1 DUF58 domain-containing protein [Bacillus alkalicola]
MTSLLPNQLRLQLTKLQWQTSSQKRGSQNGRRRSSTYGSSLDFSDFRPYQLGDDIRQIDWNVYARTHKHYIKRFLDEQELSITIFIDCSISMGKERKKWKMAKALAAMVAYIGLANDDRVSIIPVSNDNYPFLNKKGMVFTQEMLSQVDTYQATEEKGFFELLASFRQSKSNLSFIISDFLEPIEIIVEKLKHIQVNQHLRIIHLLSEEELHPSFNGDVNLLDVEKKLAPVQVSVNRQVIYAYKERLTKHCKQIEKLCHERGMEYIKLSTAQSLESILYHNMKQRGWL